MFIENFERRRLLSVSVTEGYPGYYEIQGDGSADTIQISVSMSGESFTLDRTTYSGVSYILVNGGGGNDTIAVISEEGSGIIGAGIIGGCGADAIALNFDGAVWGGNGSDVIKLSDSFRGEVYGEAGNDRMYISGACVDAEIRGGDGNDFIDCGGNICSVIARGGGGNDTIYGSDYDDALYGDEGNDIVYAGSGDDVVYSADGDTVDGGGGYDALAGGTSNTVNVELFI